MSYEGRFAVLSGLDDSTKPAAESHMHLDTEDDDKNVRINSRDYARTSGGSCACQSKPQITVGGDGVDVHAFEASPRFADEAGGRDCIGFKSNPILKGNTGTLTGALRCYEGKLETDLGNSRVTAVMAVLEAMSNVRGTITQGPTVILVNKGEYAVWESVMELKGAEAGVWNNDPTTELNNPGGTVKGYIKVIVNAVDRYIALYEKGSLAD